VKYILDTNIWLLAMDSMEALPPQVSKVLSTAANVPVGLSAISPWEVFKKESIGKLHFTRPVRQWVNIATRPEFIELIPLTPEISYESCQLPGPFHRDPANQIVVATARVHGLTLITKDKSVLDYLHVQTLWE